MARTFRGLTLTHPCFSVDDKVNKNHAHLPVPPGCSTCCRSCDWKINDVDIQSGVASMIITPQEAVEMVHRVVEFCPDTTVAGIAEPGDTLAMPYALETFRLIEQEFPDVIKCISTNGLLLLEYAQEIIDAGIDTLTVTVNTLGPEIQAQIRSGIVYHGKRYEGVEATGILVKNQLRGVGIVSKVDTTVKVNTVPISEINAGHIETAAQTVAEANARIYNIIPLVSQCEPPWCLAPGYVVLSQARYEAGAYTDVFRHYQRYRANTVGTPGGEDFVRQIYTRPVAQQDIFSHK